MSSGRKITLKSSDGETLEVEEAVALESQTIKHAIEDHCADNGIPLPNVTSKILSKVIEYCKKHVEAQERSAWPDDDLKAWDVEFVKVNQAILFDLFLAANYLNIKSLLDLTCQTVADMIKGKTPEKIRQTFNIENDFTPEEEEEDRMWELEARMWELEAKLKLMSEMAWAFKGDDPLVCSLVREYELCLEEYNSNSLVVGNRKINRHWSFENGKINGPLSEDPK